MKKRTILMMYFAIAIFLSAIETVLLPTTVIPGIKIGLANLVTIILIYQFGVKEAVYVGVLRVITVSFVIGTFFTPTFFISIGGFSVAIICLIIAYKLKVFSPVGVSVTSSIGHIIGQTVSVVLILQTNSILLILPYLVYFAIVTGAINGYIAIKSLKILWIRMEKNYDI